MTNKSGIIRQSRIPEYIVIPKGLAGVSEKDIGTYVKMRNLPQKKADGIPWDFSVDGYIDWYKEHGGEVMKRDAVYASLKRLAEAGWIERYQIKDGKGQFSIMVYDLLSECKTPLAEKPHTDNTNTEKPYAEIPTQTNNKNKDNIESTHSTREAAREKLFKQAWESEQWRENVMMNTKVLDETKLAEWWEKFKLDSRANDKLHANIMDVRSNFNSWLKIQIKNNDTISYRSRKDQREEDRQYRYEQYAGAIRAAQANTGKVRNSGLFD